MGRTLRPFRFYVVTKRRGMSHILLAAEDYTLKKFKRSDGYFTWKTAKKLKHIP